MDPTSSAHKRLKQAIADIKTARGGKKTTGKSRIRKQKLEPPQKARVTPEGTANGHNVSTEDIAVGPEVVLVDPGSMSSSPDPAADAMLAGLMGHEGWRLRQKSILPDKEKDWKKEHYLTHYRNTVIALEIHKSVLKELIKNLITEEKFWKAYLVLRRLIGVDYEIKGLLQAAKDKQKEK